LILVVGIDPGSNYTGFAVYDATAKAFVMTGESDDPVIIWDAVQAVILSEEPEAVHFAVEGFYGNGLRNKEGVRTTELVGYFYERAREAGYPVEKRGSQARLANVSEVPKNVTGKDEKSAAAHALAYAEERL
jgi:hypothetical protein